MILRVSWLSPLLSLRIKADSVGFSSTDRGRPSRIALFSALYSRLSLSLFLSYFFPREKSPILLLGSSEFDDFPSALIALGLNLLGCFACGISENLESASFLSAREASAVVVESFVKF